MSYSFAQPGVFIVPLTVTNTDVASDTYTVTRAVTVTKLAEVTVIEYIYDDLNRLTAADYSTGESFTYAYDAVGNRTAMTDTAGVHTYTYDAANRLTHRDVSDGRTYTYDWSARGQLLAEYTQGYPVRTFTYDGAGQLVEATVFTQTTRFRYNGLGARIAVEVVGHGTTTYALDYAGRNAGGFSAPILAETSLTETVLYLYGHECLGEVRDAEPLYYLHDAGGYVRQGVDVQGDLTATWLFDPDGTMLEGPDGPVSHLICGGVYDGSTGLIYRGGRYFDPNLGIWLALIPLLVVQIQRKKRPGRCRWEIVLFVGLFTVSLLAGCEGSQDLPPLQDVCISDMTWLDEMDQQMWEKYPNSCGAMALYMFLEAENVSVELSDLIQQLQEERPGGYDGYCCSQGWNQFSTPTPDPQGWCNEACVSAEALAEVARKHYGLPIQSGDNWTREKIHEKLLNGHPVLALVRVNMSINEFGHFVVIRGFSDEGANVLINDSYPNNNLRTWDMSSEERQAIGEKRSVDWWKFDASWASAVDSGKDPLALEGHTRWAMAVK